MIFPLIETEPIVQVNDKTRLSAVKTFKSNDEAAITLVRIEPEAGNGFIDVTGAIVNSKNWYLDWAYATDGDKVITLEVTTDGVAVTFTKTLTVILEADDKLWSTDDDLQLLEPDIMGWIRQGRASYKDMHRMSQKRILEWFDNIKVWDKDGLPFDKDDVDTVMAATDLKRISAYWTLESIFGGLSNKTDDVFFEKQKLYRALRKEQQADRSRIRVDYNKDGTQDVQEQFVLVNSIRMTR